MKHLKIYENINDIPKIGDFVITTDNTWPEVNYYIENNIGIYLKTYIDENEKLLYIIEYENIPKEIKEYFEIDDSNPKKGFRYYEPSEIIHFSKNKEKLEVLLYTNKYNI